MGQQEPCFSFSTLNFPFLPSMLSPEHPSTPPLQTLASVPFKWEELPGKPRPCTDIVVRPESAKCLELPPCHRITKISSPTTVLDGPYIVGRPKFFSFREARGHGSFDSVSSGGASPHSSVDVWLGKKKTTTLFGRSFKLRSGGKREVDRGSFGFSPGGCEKVKTVGKNLLLRRNGSFSQASSTQLWATVREGLKKAMPWKSSRKSKNEGAFLKESK